MIGKSMLIPSQRAEMTVHWQHTPCHQAHGSWQSLSTLSHMSAELDNIVEDRSPRMGVKRRGAAHFLPRARGTGQGLLAR